MCIFGDCFITLQRKIRKRACNNKQFKTELKFSSLLKPNNILTGCKIILIFNFDSIQLDTFSQIEQF